MSRCHRLVLIRLEIMAVVEVNDVSYKRHVFNQLKQRNQIQSEAFKQLIQQRILVRRLLSRFYLFVLNLLKIIVF